MYTRRCVSNDQCSITVSVDIYPQIIRVQCDLNTKESLCDQKRGGWDINGVFELLKFSVFILSEFFSVKMLFSWKE